MSNWTENEKIAARIVDISVEKVPSRGKARYIAQQLDDLDSVIDRFGVEGLFEAVRLGFALLSARIYELEENEARREEWGDNQ